MPPAIRAQLRLQAKREEANRHIVFADVSQAQKDTTAELTSICDPASCQLLSLKPDPESVSLRTTSEGRPAGLERFFLDLWPRLIYANPAVRFGVQLHYTRASLLRMNRSLEKQAQELETRISEIKETIQRFEEERADAKKKKAFDMGIQLLELESIADPEDQARVSQIKQRRRQMDKLGDEAERIRQRATPVENLEGKDRIKDQEAAREAAILQAAKQLSGEIEIEEESDAQVLGPLSPKTVIEARRAGRPVKFPIRHCLEVLYRDSGMRSFDLPTGPDADPLLVLREVGLRHEALAMAAASQQDEVLRDLPMIAVAQGLSTGR